MKRLMILFCISALLIVSAHSPMTWRVVAVGGRAAALSAESAKVEHFVPADERDSAGFPLAPIGLYAGELAEQAGLDTGIEALKRAYGVSGRGTTIAVVGSGIDVGHRDLQVPPAVGGFKIADWADFTSEGLVMTETCTGARGRIDSRFGIFKTGGIRSLSGAFRLGILREASLAPAGAIGQDLNGNGLITDFFPVLVVDSTRKGVYDRVYVDTNQNRDFTDEVPLGGYRETHTFSRFRDKDDSGGDRAALHFVVADVARDGSRVRLGFDSTGAGTFLAGLVGAKATGAEGPGIAPGAALMALKALDSTGRSSVDAYSDAIRYAARNGAKVILVDWGIANLSRDDALTMRRLIGDIVSQHDPVILFPAGDGGPGLETSDAPTDSVFSLAVGASLGSGASAHPWAKSAVGPTRCDGWAPDVLAPMAASATVPTWLSRSGYALGHGTRIAAAHVAGAAALLIQACGLTGVPYEARGVLAAIRASGSPLADFESVEQGGGLIDAEAAFQMLRSGLRTPMTVFAEEVDGYRDGGLFARGVRPGTIRFYVDNFSGISSEIAFEADREWVEPVPERLVMPAVGERSLIFSYQYPGPGLKSATVTGVDSKSGRVLAVFRQIVVGPSDLSREGPTRLEDRRALSPGRYHRHFVSVRPGTTSLVVSARNYGEEPVEVQVVGPGGRRVYGEELGAGAAWRRGIIVPEEGVWEIVALREHGESDVSISLEAIAEGFSASPLTVIESGPAESGLTESRLAESKPVESKLALGLSNWWKDASVRLVPSVRLARSHGDDVARARIEPEQSFSKRFAVEEGTSRLRILTRNRLPSSADVGLYLHRFDQQSGWTEVAAATTAEASDGVIDLSDPIPGDYTLYLESRYGGEVVCEVLVEGYRDADWVKVEPSEAVFTRYGQVVPVSLSLDPAKGAKQIHLQVVNSTDGRMIASIPMLVEGTTGSSWSVDLGGMAPGGRRYVTVSNHSLGAESQMVMIDGRVYVFDGGAVTLALPAPGEVEINLLIDGRPGPTRRFRIDRAPAAPAAIPEPSSDPEKEILREGLLKRLGF